MFGNFISNCLSFINKTVIHPSAYQLQTEYSICIQKVDKLFEICNKLRSLLSLALQVS